jgi:ABC-2 type transport system permease protein
MTAIRDAYIILKNELMLTLRNPFWIGFGLFQPVVYLLLFYPFLKGVAQAPGFPNANTIQFFAPGLFIMSAFMNGSYSGFGLLDRLESGFLERVRVTPVSRIGLVFGFVSNEGAQTIIQSSVLFITTLFFGLRFSVFGAVLLFLLLLLLGITMTAASYAVTLKVKTTDGLVAISNFFAMPMLLLSGVMLPLNFAPRIIQWLSAFDPLTYAVSAARALIAGQVFSNAVLQAFGIFAILAVAALWWLNKEMQNAVS